MSTPRQFFKRKNFGQFVQCTEQEYRDWETRCKADPFYATSHAEEYRINYDLDLDEFQAEGVAAPLEPSPPTRCSFCHKDSKQIDYIITSPIDYSPAAICDECVNVCESILIERDGKKRSQAEPSTSVEDAFREWIQEGDNSKFWSASLDKKERYVKKFAEFYAATVSKNLQTELANAKRELNGTPDNAVWSKQQWVDNAGYWHSEWNKAIEQREDAYARIDGLEQANLLAESLTIHLDKARREITQAQHWVCDNRRRATLLKARILDLEKEIAAPRETKC